MTAPPPWSACHKQLARLAQRQLFFVGGAPRSGTTWLQRCLERTSFAALTGGRPAGAAQDGALPAQGRGRRLALHPHARPGRAGAA